MALEREQRMMSQVQEGLVTMNDIIKGTKEQNLISLSHQQTLLSEQNKRLKDMVDSIQASVYGRQSAIESELNDHRAKLQEMESVVVKSVTNANRTVESELSRFEKIISAFEKYIDTQVSEVKAQNQSYLEESRAGRGESFVELLRKQEDMQGRVAALTSRLTKVEDDSRDRASTLREELKVVETAHSQQILEL